jgi:hypothetical protein
MITDWLNFILSAFSILASYIFIFEGARLIAVNGATRKAVATILFGIITSVPWALINYDKYLTVTNILARMESSGELKVPSPQELMSTSISPEQREKISFAMARQEYYYQGKLTNYINRNNESKIYSPLQKEIEEREEILIQNTQLRFKANARRQDAILISFWILFFAIFGYVSGRRSKRDR